LVDALGLVFVVVLHCEYSRAIKNKPAAAKSPSRGIVFVVVALPKIGYEKIYFSSKIVFGLIFFVSLQYEYKRTIKNKPAATEAAFGGVVFFVVDARKRNILRAAAALP
jgi:heme/copper-type cytochrome/quinol oxidase subunit 3